MKLRITVQGVSYDVGVEVLDDTAAPPSGAPAAAATPAPTASHGAQVTSPIAGNVFDIRVKPGDSVKVNDTLVVIEAMKMESNIASTHDGVIKEICVKIGDSVTHDQVLVKFR